MRLIKSVDWRCTFANTLRQVPSCYHRACAAQSIHTTATYRDSLCTQQGMFSNRDLMFFFSRLASFHCPDLCLPHGMFCFTNIRTHQCYEEAQVFRANWTACQQTSKQEYPKNNRILTFSECAKDLGGMSTAYLVLEYCRRVRGLEFRDSEISATGQLGERGSSAMSALSWSGFMLAGTFSVPKTIKPWAIA